MTADGSGPAFQIPRSRSAQHVPGMFSRVDAGCVRFFSADLCNRADGARFRHKRRRSRLCDHDHSCDATCGRVHLRFARRPVRTAYSTHDRHCFLFAHGITHSIFAKLHLAADFSRALRDRHGWRMGTRRITGNGIASSGRARVVLRNFAAGIYVWLFVRRASLRNCISALRLARIVCGRHAASAIGYLHSRQGSRVASLAAPNINHHLLKQNKIGYDG